MYIYKRDLVRYIILFVLCVLVQWMSEGVTAANQYEQAELGKTEISLMHFSVGIIHVYYFNTELHIVVEVKCSGLMKSKGFGGDGGMCNVHMLYSFYLCAYTYVYI